MEDLVNLCKKKGFVFQSSECYSPMPGFFDYGPLGVEMKNNIKRLWWRDMVQRREDVVGLDSSIISSPLIWQASGHIAGFSDPMVDCKDSKQRFRADQVLWAAVRGKDGSVLTYISLLESADSEAQAAQEAAKRLKALGRKPTEALPLELKDLTEAPADIYHLIPSPATGQAGGLTPPRDFNLMFSTSVGAVADAAAVAYLRPETAQGIFTNFAAVQRSARMKIPFGIAQVGKAFRNEITPRNFVFRSREFEQMEIEYFIAPGDDVWPKHHAEWVASSWQWLRSVGLREELMALHEHPKDKLAHYARACTDVTFRFPFGQHELMGVAARGDFDLAAHSAHSGRSMTYLDPASGERYLPHVIEPSLGVDRLFLALLVSAYREEEVGGEKRVVLGLSPAIAPVKVSVLPLLSNKPELTAKARDVFARLQRRHNVEFDSSGAIGRRYRRADEAGTPFCVTVDFDSLQDDTVTVRLRDSMEQLRMPVEQMLQFVSDRIDPLP